MYCHESNNKGKGCGSKVVKVVGFVFVGLFFAVIFALIFGFAVMFLWNELMPTIFNLPQISYLQAFGIVILAKILFGFGHHPKHSPHPHKSHHHPWEKKLELKLENDCGPFGSHKHRKYFKQYWKEEGRTAFESYIKNVEEDDDEDDESEQKE